MSALTNKLAFTIAELAQVAGVGRSFIYEEIRGGRLKVRKAGRRTLILHSAASDWLVAMPELWVNTQKREVGE